MDILALARKRFEHLLNARRSRQEIERRQLRKFRKLAAHAVKHAPYYRDIAAERRIDVASCTPSDFPVLTKTELMRNFDRIVTVPGIRRTAIDPFLQSRRSVDERFLGKYYVACSSGTSGEKGIFVFSPSDWSRGAAQALRVNPPVLRKRRIAFVGSAGSIGVTLASSTRKWPMRWLYESASFDTNLPMTQLCERVNAFGPDILMGYPSALAVLAERQLAGALHIKPSLVQTSAEVLTPSTRALIEQGFGIPVRNCYACSEHLIMGLAHPDFDGMYLFEDDLIFELNSDHTVVTNLFNYTQPLIRYRMNDLLVPTQDNLNAYPFIKVAEIVGRKEATIVFTNRHGVDDFISPSAIASFGVDKLRRFQIELKSKTSCTIRAALIPDLDQSTKDATLAEVRERFCGLLQHKEMHNVIVDIEERDDLCPDAKTGKYSYVVRAP